MRTKNSKLKTKRECEIAYTTLNRLYNLCNNYNSVDEVKFAIMLMKAQIHETQQLIEIEDMKEQVEYFNKRVKDIMSCRNSPCHKCHHLFNGCYEPTTEIVEEIERLWINSQE